MKIIKEGVVYQLVFLPHFFPVNCYLIEEDKELTLIDTGLPNSYKGIIQAIKMIKKPLTNIILTHAHADHVGSLDVLKKKFPNVSILISIRDSRLLMGDISLDQNEPQTPIKGGIPKNIQTKPTHLLTEGDSIGSLEVINTPGHTPGSISLLETRTHSIIVGDALQTRGGIAVSGQIKPFFPFPAFATWNKQLAIHSAKKISQLSPKLLAVGHGMMIKNPKNTMQKAIAQAEKIC
ncbi:MBL fold metallo-hydrolase [Bacillus aquiflavi]|uniref:MBL fold metallo-hydrolase n=1 Tax=Bacillus aquiflavi TaxID=2672567 RepID=A0A6B3VTT0_9BACI|nr:MBL fold metallo-hydrolase [Bacillus aquiflavi]MBA4535989.1 MBL fold metallo-hydrolase [Bacillus aquiflavi]NEY80362.1 MBL fold metallo-hydrolase [Bacillus aquiflavi]